MKRKDKWDLFAEVCRLCSRTAKLSNEVHRFGVGKGGCWKACYRSDFTSAWNVQTICTHHIIIWLEKRRFQSLNDRAQKICINEYSIPQIMINKLIASCSNTDFAHTSALYLTALTAWTFLYTLLSTSNKPGPHLFVLCIMLTSDPDNQVQHKSRHYKLRKELRRVSSHPECRSWGAEAPHGARPLQHAPRLRWTPCPSFQIPPPQEYAEYGCLHKSKEPHAWLHSERQVPNYNNQDIWNLNCQYYLVQGCRWKGITNPLYGHPNIISWLGLTGHQFHSVQHFGVRLHCNKLILQEVTL